MMRVEAAGRIFPRCWFDEKAIEAGRDALGYYHERRDENRNVGLGPEHDWSSHAADAFGYLAISYEEPPAKSSDSRRPFPPRAGSHWAA
jgi:phage terminase large subunit